VVAGLGGGNFQLVTSPTQVTLMSGVAANFFRPFLIGRQHVQKVPQWYGESVAFWDGAKLVVWTANVQPWTLSHSMFEFSGKLETIETFEPGSMPRATSRASPAKPGSTTTMHSWSRCTT